MDKQYQHHQYEDQIYQLWQDADVFNPDSSPNAGTKQPFSILMPPPNANDPLHIGHAMFVTVEDILTRYHRMLGEDTLWLPGADHAGIETQFVYEKKLKKQDQSRFDFSREELYQQIWDYVQENSDTAVEQLKKIGASADWSRFTFMLDEKVVNIVLNTFLELNEKDLVYRDIQLINYCTSCGTGFSDLEVVHQERTSPLYYLKYGPFVVATTRPETKFGDTALAVHPADERYQQYVGHEIEVEGLTGRFRLRVIADEFVDPEFGTGVVKITPAHDVNDFQVWQRHQDEIPGPKQVIDFHGHLTEAAGEFAGQYLLKARKNVVAALKSRGLIEKIDENYNHTVGTCYRCGTIIEPLPLPQFFVKVKPLTRLALQALNDKKIAIHGAGHDKILKHWLENLHDWNISRQIVWGIRLPVWYAVEDNLNIAITFINEAGETIQGTLAELLDTQGGSYPISAIKAGLQELRAPIDARYLLSIDAPGDNYLQETDTFDTWFSSAQWPYTTLLTNPGDFARFYPTSVMETAYDILPFWVMRMIMISLFKTGEIPFKNVYFHGLIRDEKGVKMSKSKGNVINPLEVINQYGADALRMALVIRSSAGLDKAVGEADFKAMRNLTNKVWNASRFIVLSRAENQDNDSLSISPTNETAAGQNDAAFTTKLNQVAANITQQLNDFKIGLAAETVYNEFWHWFCDECIEDTKQGNISPDVLYEGLLTFLKLLHPFIPFVTEAIWQELGEEGLLISAEWPE